jgi:hypothetical protein
VFFFENQKKFLQRRGCLKNDLWPYGNVTHEQKTPNRSHTAIIAIDLMKTSLISSRHCGTKLQTETKKHFKKISSGPSMPVFLFIFKKTFFFQKTGFFIQKKGPSTLQAFKTWGQPPHKNKGQVQRNRKSPLHQVGGWKKRFENENSRIFMFAKRITKKEQNKHSPNHVTS